MAAAARAEARASKSSGSFFMSCTDEQTPAGVPSLDNQNMSVSADTLRLHLDYTAWASGKLLAEAAKLTPEELTRDFKTADKNVLDKLLHVYAADRSWLSPIQVDSPSTFLSEEDRG